MNTTPSTTSTTPSWHPTEEQITERARQIWRARGRPPGQDIEIWLEAEQQLRAEPHVEPVAPVAPVAPPVRRAKKAPTGRSLQEMMDDSLPRGGYGEGGPNKVGPST
jgi:hypothetical protein